MNSLRKTLLFSAFAILLIFGGAVRAQGPSNAYIEMRDLLTDYITLASQAEGDAQQVETAANNGNMNLYHNSTGHLIRAMSEINLLKMEMRSRSVPNPSVQAGIEELLLLIEGDIQLWAAYQRANVQGVGVIAGRLRDSLHDHKGFAQEKRVALCCAMN